MLRARRVETQFWDSLENATFPIFDVHPVARVAGDYQDRTTVNNNEVVVARMSRWTSRLGVFGALCLAVTGIAVTVPLTAQAAETLFASSVMKSANAYVSSSEYATVKGGATHVAVGHDGWLNITAKGQTQKKMGSVWAAGINFSATPNAWGTYSGTNTSPGRNNVWWYYPSSTPNNYAISGKVTY